MRFSPFVNQNGLRLSIPRLSKPSRAIVPNQNATSAQGRFSFM
jgi:hypothetical protein